MAKKDSFKAYVAELKKMIESRTAEKMELWLNPQVRATAANMVILDKIQEEILDLDHLVNPEKGSTGQIKNEVSPLLPHYDKCQRTLLMQLEALGLNYSTTPSKVNENTKKGVDSKKAGLAKLLQETQDDMNDIPEP